MSRQIRFWHPSPLRATPNAPRQIVDRNALLQSEWVLRCTKNNQLIAKPWFAVDRLVSNDIFDEPQVYLPHQNELGNTGRIIALQVDVDVWITRDEVHQYVDYDVFAIVYEAPMVNAPAMSLPRNSPSNSAAKSRRRWACGRAARPVGLRISCLPTRSKRFCP